MTLNTHWLAIRGLSQPPLADATSVTVDCKIDGKEEQITLPFRKDTFLWKNSDIAKATDTTLHIRDNHYAVALVQLDLTSLPKDAEILSASLNFRVNYVENKNQPGEILCSRILTPWSEDATWVKPDHKADTGWDGMKAGHDYAPSPFASIKVDHLEAVKGGQPISIPGFADAVKAWKDGTWDNDGFVITFSGPAVQIGIPSSKAHALQNFRLGGSFAGGLLLVPNLPLLNRVAPNPLDILEAHPVITIRGNAKAPASGASPHLSIYDVTPSEDYKSIAPQSERKLLGATPLTNLSPNGLLTLPDLAKVIRNWLATPDQPHALDIEIEGSGDAQLVVSNEGSAAPSLQLKLPSYTPAQLFQPPLSPKPGVYTQVQNGHLSYDGKRLRLWGVVGSPDVQRLVDLGFNAERIWNPAAHVTYTPDSAKHGELATYTKGDGSKFDLADKHFAELKSHGLFVMFAALNDTIPPSLLLDDDSFVTKGDDWNAWKTAIKGSIGKADLNNYLYFDKRLQEIKKRHAKNLLTHVNPYTGKAYGEDEAIAVYEVFNENGALYKTLSAGLSKWNPFFLKELQDQWNDWLRKKYTDDDGLTQSWGSLKPGESLVNGTVAPAPDIARKGDYPEQRADDFTRFLAESENAFHQDFRSYCRSLFPKGVGANVAPFSFDTLFRPNITWSYYQSLGDVNSFGMYFWNLQSSLGKPPAAFVIDSFTVENTPSILYETNAARPSPYRSEYPIKLAALASYQDWDGAFWHYWGSDGQGDSADLGYLTATMAPPFADNVWAAVHHEADPVMCSAMTMAGQIFLHGLIPPAAKPDIIELGGNAIFSYSNFSGIDLAPSTFKNGSALKFTPNADSGVTMNGGPMPAPVRIDQAIASGPYIKWDWPNSRLIIDAPSVKAYVGKISAPFRFSDGITLGDVSTPWICFSMVSDDGTPLAGNSPVKRILMSGVYDAKNSGFQFNYDVQGGPAEQAHAVGNFGREPILVTPVEYKVWFPTKVTGNLKSYDFALRQTQDLPIADTNEISQRGPTPYLDVFSLNKRGAPSDLPLDQETPIQIQGQSPETAALATTPAPTAASSSLILPELPWDLSYKDSLQALKASTYPYTNISSEDSDPGTKKQIDITGVRLPSLWNEQADISLHFSDDKLSTLEVTFTQPPALSVVVESFTKLLGRPVEETVAAQYGDTRAHWVGNKKPHDVLVTESQGIMKILISP